jgi:asparagine synthase (glutamine-hydrolysing)
VCGIAGFWGDFGRQRLEAMVAAIAHRGPDGAGIELVAGPWEGAVGLGHRRLSIIDLEGGRQPMWSVDGSVAIIFNGEIYNYRALKADLTRRGAQFATNSDTEVILEGWRLLGPDILPLLEGMFAFAIWDTRRNEWILARDRWGIKPLYLATPKPGTIAFASEVKPLLPLVGAVAPDLGALYRFLLYGWVPGPQTLFAGIRHLEPGTMLRWRPDMPSGSVTRFATVSVDPDPRPSADIVDRLRAEFDRAVADHLVADVPVGITLSGGLDSSSALASMARLHDPAGIDAFTVGFELADDETPFAVRMARHVGVRHHVRNVPAERIASQFSSIVRSLEEPIAHPVLQTTFEAARFARERLKVVLIGEGSDELFLGYPQYRTLTWPLRFLPDALRGKFYIDVCCVMPTASDLSGMLAPEFLDRDLLDDVAHEFDPYFRSGGFDTGAQLFELHKPLIANQLMRIDKLTMSVGLEARVPFLDNRFAALALSLPVSARLANGRTKIALRRAMADRLPPEIVDRPKTGKGGTQALLPFLQRLVSDGPLSGLVSRTAIAKRGWLRADAVYDYLSRRNSPFVKMHPVESRRRAKFAYALAVLEQWGRIFVDRNEMT